MVVPHRPVVPARGRSGSSLTVGGNPAAAAEFYIPEVSQSRSFNNRETSIRSTAMLSLVVTLLIIALIAAVLGFGGIAGAAVGIAKIVFLVALVLFVLSLIAGGMRGGFGRRF
jgi:uncharacterized membrane protein YtjA (UPF0391 family)